MRFQAFEKIAAVSSGQVYFFDKQNVKEMVEYLEVAIQGSVQNWLTRPSIAFKHMHFGMLRFKSI